MHEIDCPHCGKAFKIDEAGYADILKQVRDESFAEELHERLELAAQEKKVAIELAETKVASQLKEVAAQKDLEIERLREELKASSELAQAKVSGDFKDEVVKKDAEIEKLRAELEKADVAGKLALREALGDVEKERDDLRRTLDAKETEQKLLENSLK